MELPYELKTAIDAEFTGGASVRPAASALSARYRAGSPGGSGFISGAGDAAAYAATRMPATYAAAHTALTAAAAHMPDFRPRSLLDAGAGPGTAAWAAVSVWPGLEEITLLERDQSMAALGRRLAARAPTPALHGGNWVAADMTGSWNAGQCDIAVLCYALGELPGDMQPAVVRKLWEASTALVIVEPGTPAGWARVHQARGMLADLGAAIAAPCPGNVPCPQAQGWCHFSARVARSRMHRQAKDAALPYEDEKFSYLVVTKAECNPCDARVLRHPGVRKGHVELVLCTADGLKDVTVSKRMGEDYRRARDLKWGDATLPFHIREL